MSTSGKSGLSAFREPEQKSSTVTKIFRLAIASVLILGAFYLVQVRINIIRSQHELKMSRLVAEKTSQTNTQRKIMVKRALEMNPYFGDAIYDRASILIAEAKERYRKGQSNLIDEENLLAAYQSLGQTIETFDYKPRVYRLRGEMALILSSYYSSQGKPAIAKDYQKKGFDDLLTAARFLPRPLQLRQNFNASVVLAAQANQEHAVAAEFIDKAERSYERGIMIEQQMMQANARTWINLGLMPFQINEIQYGMLHTPQDPIWANGLFIAATEFGMEEVAINTLREARLQGDLDSMGERLLAELEKSIESQGIPELLQNPESTESLSEIPMINPEDPDTENPTLEEPEKEEL